MEHPGVAGEGHLATKKKDLEGEAGVAFSIQDILGSRNSGRKKKPDQPPIMPPFFPPPLPPTHLPLFHPLPPIFPFLPFAFNSETRRSSSPAQKKVRATFNQCFCGNFSALTLKIKFSKMLVLPLLINMLWQQWLLKSKFSNIFCFSDSNILQQGADANTWGPI